VSRYSHQIPPGAADSIHYRLEVPEEVTEQIANSDVNDDCEAGMDDVDYLVGPRRPRRHVGGGSYRPGTLPCHRLGRRPMVDKGGSGWPSAGRGRRSA